MPTFSPGSYLAIVIVLILTGAGLPLPEEVPVITAGVLAATEVLDPWIALVCCIFGALAGDCIMYFVGYHFGRGLLQDHPWWVRFITPEREEKVEQMFKQHGLKVFFIARFLVMFRSPLLLAAGILRVSFRRFLLIDLFSAAVVVSAFFGLSYQFGPAIGRMIKTTEVFLTVIAVIVLIIAIIYLWRRHKRKLVAMHPEQDNESSGTPRASISIEGSATPDASGGEIHAVESSSNGSKSSANTAAKPRQ
jgi:membrane protein DedA with SNARE-associated domain